MIVGMMTSLLKMQWRKHVSVEDGEKLLAAFGIVMILSSVGMMVLLTHILSLPPMIAVVVLPLLVFAVSTMIFFTFTGLSDLLYKWCR